MFTTQWVCQDLNLGHLPLSKLGMWYHRAATASLACCQSPKAWGHSLLYRGSAHGWGGQPCPGRWHCHMKHCPLAGQVPQPSLQFARVGQATFSPSWSTGMWVHAHSLGTHSSFPGSSPLEATAWPGMRGSPTECQLAHHLCYSQVRASSKISAALPAVLADAVLRSPG